MNRRDFFQRAALVASGVVAADQLDLLERLGWVRRFFASFTMPASGVNVSGVHVSSAQWDALLQECYVRDGIVAALNTVTPFKAQFRGLPASFVPFDVVPRHG